MLIGAALVLNKFRNEFKGSVRFVFQPGEEIVAAGKGKLLDNGDVRPLDVQVGDSVLFGKYSGTEVKLNGEEVLVMREEDIMGVIES